LLVVTVYILIQTEVGKAAQVAKDIVEIKGMEQAEAVTGPYDVIVRVEARNIDELAKLVVARTGGQRDHEDPHLSGGAPLALLDHVSGRPPTAAATAMRADRGGRRRAAASGASW
jgi:DNA-binding Lrp family transcriptional regulator